MRKLRGLGIRCDGPSLQTQRKRASLHHFAFSFTPCPCCPSIPSHICPRSSSSILLDMAHSKAEAEEQFAWGRRTRPSNPCRGGFLASRFPSRDGSKKHYWLGPRVKRMDSSGLKQIQMLMPDAPAMTRLRFVFFDGMHKKPFEPSKSVLSPTLYPIQFSLGLSTPRRVQR